MVVIRLLKISTVFARAHRTGGGQSTNVWWTSVSKAPDSCVYSYSEGSFIVILTLNVDNIV